MKARSQLVMVLALFALHGCVAPKAEGFPESYYELKVSAINGDMPAVTKLLKYTSKTDGEQSLSHGETLLAIREAIGGSRFGVVLSKMPRDQRENINSIMLAAQQNRDAAAFWKKTKEP